MVNKLTNTVKPLDEVDKINEIIDALDDKQDTLVSGTNIKTINNNSILGSGNLALDGLPSQTGNANKFLTTDGTDASWAAVPTRNIGEIVPSTIPLTDAGLHLLDGSLIQGGGIYSAFVTYIAGLVSTYPDLFTTEADWQTAVTTYGVCGKFVYDSTNNTVRLPKITGILEGTTDVTALGDLVEAGLPNITGSWTPQIITADSQTRASGAFSATYHGLANMSSGAGWQKQNLYFNASSSNSIYGNSLTVQPQTIKCYYYIVIATSTKTDIEVDIDEVVTDLNGKADVDLTNVNNNGTSRGAGWAMPSSTYIDLTLGASGTNYTAPANGYYAIRMTSTGAQFISMFNNNNGAQSYQVLPGSGWEAGTHIEAKKGQIISIAYNCPTKNMFRFIYAVGSESEA